MPVVQQVVDGGLIGCVEHGLPDAQVAEGRAPHVHDHLEPGSGLVAGQQREALRIAVVIDVGGGQIHGDMGVASADDVAQDRLLADEADGHALDLGRTRLPADPVPSAVAVPTPHGHVVVGHPLLQQERPGAHQMPVELLDAPPLGGCRRPDRDPAEGVEDGYPRRLVVERDRGVVDHLTLSTVRVGRHLDRRRRGPPSPRSASPGRGCARRCTSDGLGVEAMGSVLQNMTPLRRLNVHSSWRRSLDERPARGPARWMEPSPSGPSYRMGRATPAADR